MNKHLFFAILSGALYGTLGLFGVLLQRYGLGIIEFSYWRFLITVLVMGPVLFLTKSKSQTLDKKNGLLIAVFSGLFYSTSTASYFLAIDYIGTGLAMVMFFCYPIFVILLQAVVDKVYPSQGTLFALLLIMSGLSLLVDYDQLEVSMTGIGLGLLCAALFGAYFYGGQKYMKTMPVTEGTFWISLGNFVAFSLAVLFVPEFNIKPTQEVFASLLGISIVSTLLPIYLVFRSLEKLTAANASICSVFEPVVTIILGALFLNEIVSLVQGIGICIILLSILLVHRDSKKSEVDLPTLA